MERGNDGPRGLFTAEIVSGEERDNYGEKDRRHPIEEAPPFRDLVIHKFFA